jgi:flavin reductase (DIM6/NTAB) family NADH-FMN oxidoreductase RutF
MSITEDQFRKALGLLPTGVTVVTTPQGEGQDVGITISSFTSVSLAPPPKFYFVFLNSLDPSLCLKRLPIFLLTY